MTTLSTDLLFEPKVWQDHVGAYFREKLVYGQFAFNPDPSEQMKKAGSGDTIAFPYYGKISGAEKPTENVALSVDKLNDNSFSASVYEVGKALGFTDTAYVVSGDGKKGLTDEALRQMARVHAEQIDADLLEEIHTSYVDGYVGSQATDTMSVKKLLEAKVTAFGDRAEESVVCFMHSKQGLDLMQDSGTGFLKADANDPLYGMKGFIGRMLGMAIVTVDSTKRNTDGISSGVDSYEAIFCKEKAYGFMCKQEMRFEMDRDILARKDLMASTEWYAVKNFDSKYAADDRRIGRIVTA